jgi:hypothetical protein
MEVIHCNFKEHSNIPNKHIQVYQEKITGPNLEFKK